MRFRRIRTVDLGRFSCCRWWSDFCPVSGVHPLRSPASGVPPWSRSKEEKLPLPQGLGRFLNIKKPSRTPPLPRGFRDMFRYVLERSFDDSFTIFTIFEKWAFMILSDFLDIRKNATHFFHTFPQEHGRTPPQTRPKLSSICTGLCKAAFEMLIRVFHSRLHSCPC